MAIETYGRWPWVSTALAGPAALAVLALEAGNVALHGGTALRTHAYNPGAVTAVGLFLPHVLAGTVWLARSGRATRASAATALAGLASAAALAPVLKRRLRR